MHIEQERAEQVLKAIRKGIVAMDKADAGKNPYREAQLAIENSLACDGWTFSEIAYGIHGFAMRAAYFPRRGEPGYIKGANP